MNNNKYRVTVKILSFACNQDITTPEVFLRISNDFDQDGIINSVDFYSLSTLKDLLFHVQEHRFTIPQIKNHLDQLGLYFCGIESNEIVSHFQKTNTNKKPP